MNNNNSTYHRTSSGNGSPGHWTSPVSSPVGSGRPPSLMDFPQSLPNVVRVVVTRDGGGYGMKVSGDNPVYVQSVKDGGPAEKAGLHAGDKIIQVNGTNVMHSTHTDVVALIKASVQVVLTVQQRNPVLRSPVIRPATVASSSRITGPQPVDDEKQYQLQQEKEQYYRLMIEKEQDHLDKLRSQVAVSPNEKKCGELAKAEKNLKILQDNLSRTLGDHHVPDICNTRPVSSPGRFGSSFRGGGSTETPPPVPKRNKQIEANLLFLSNEINANSRKPTGEDGGCLGDASGDVPPPLPPRTYPPYNNNNTEEVPAVNSIDKQMSYPLVATCTSLHNSCGSSTSSKHQRTKSSPDSLMVLSGEFVNVGNSDVVDQNYVEIFQQRPATPPGTPPPPYPSPQAQRRDKLIMGMSCDSSFEMVSNSPESSFAELQHSPRRNTPKISNTSPIRAANSRVAQQPIISMEDDDMSDLEIDQSEDHGHFKSLSRLWEHLPHLAVFMNYILSNSDPNSLLFYLLTDLYKEGNAKEMRKWAFEIHSCFLVPGAPLRLNNVDENIAREIDDDLTKEYDKEEIMRKIFWKARQRAKEELTRQLADFQQKRTAGLGTMYGPTDQELKDHYNDKGKETKLYESLFLPKLEMYLEEFDKEIYDPQKYYLASSLITVLTRIFRIRPQNFDLDRIPTFVNKERSFKSKFIGKYSRKLNHLNHQFMSQQYFTVIPCSLCSQIIYGISPQGYQCSACLINLHRPCVKRYDDSCPGPFRGKEKGIRKLIGMRHDSEQNRIRKASHFIQMEKEKRQMEERDYRTDSTDNGGIQKSLGPFQFGRLTRQTTNLERISRPFGSQKSVEGSESPGLERPMLAKSKSSSAINLSLLRTRRAKLLEQSSSALCKDEFEFIAFGSTTNLNRFPSWLHIGNKDTKVSQPVSRSGSDRRPDAVREEGARPTQDVDSQAQVQEAHDDSQSPIEKSESPTAQESAPNIQSSGAKRRGGSHINRSESVKEQSEKNRKQQRRNISDPSHSHNISCDADFDRQQILNKNADSGSSSNSSISAGVNGRLSESPSNSMDVHTATVRTQSESDSDMDGEAEPLNWQELVTEEELKKLNPNEKKRQEVINELFHTEASHVRMLKVLYKLFYRSIQSSGLLKPDEMNLIFPNIKELLDVHSDINKEMRRIRKEDPLVRQIGDVLLATFTGPQGELLQRASATYCERQQLALEFIKKRRERDNKFESLLSECEKKRQCKRLQLQGMIPAEMQRLTRYPLLLERLIKSVEEADKSCSEYKEELVKLRQAHHHSKEILGYVNEAAKLAHNRHRLEEIQRHLDISNFRGSDHPIVYDFKNIDLTRYKLILEGSLSLRRPNKAPVPVHILLLEEMVVILQKESEKFILKFFQSGSPTQQAPLSPIIKMNTLLVRENAVCKNALFLVNTSTTSSQMYDLQAEDEAKREAWRKHFSDAADAYNRREGKTSRPAGGAPILSHDIVSDSDSESIRELPTEAESASVPEGADEVEDGKDQATADRHAPSAEEGERDTPVETDPEGDRTPDVAAGGGIHLTTKVSAEEWPLIQPSQVNVAVPPVHTAESMLTPLEQIRRKDAQVKQALAEKEDLVADLLAIPREHFEHIADVASANSTDSSMPGSTGTSDITDRLLASVFQVDLLQKAVNEALNISESEVLLARGGRCPTCVSHESHYSNDIRPAIPSVPASLIRDITASLSSQLTTLLSEVKQVEEQRDVLRKELHKVREKLHEQHNLHSPVPFDDNVASDESAQDVFCEALSDEPKLG